MSQKMPKEQSMSTIKKQSKLCVPQIRMSCATVRCSVWTTDKCRSHLRLVKCSLVTSGLFARKLKHDLRLKIDDNIGWWGWWSPLPLWLSSTWWWWWWIMKMVMTETWREAGQGEGRWACASPSETHIGPVCIIIIKSRHHDHNLVLT